LEFLSIFEILFRKNIHFVPYFYTMIFNIDDSWSKLLNEEFQKEYFTNLKSFIESEYQLKPNRVFPEFSDIFNAFNSCPFSKIKVVIFGQDPYPTAGHAHGLSFSVKENVKPLPKSLKNIFIELNDDLNTKKSENGCLINWANQGVLLLNAVLTVEEGKPESHSNKGWELFTNKVIEILNEKKTNLVYILWGAKAIKKAELIDSNNNLILFAPHPSPLSAYKGFFGCKHFSKTNTYLNNKGFSSIDW
jgi:uracil-DNA glycosylase